MEQEKHGLKIDLATANQKLSLSRGQIADVKAKLRYTKQELDSKMTQIEAKIVKLLVQKNELADAKDEADILNSKLLEK